MSDDKISNKIILSLAFTSFLYKHLIHWELNTGLLVIFVFFFSFPFFQSLPSCIHEKWHVPLPKVEGCNDRHRTFSLSRKL